MFEGCSEQPDIFDPYTSAFIAPSWHGRIVMQPAPLVSRIWGTEIKGGDCAVWTGWSNGKGHAKVKIEQQNWYLHRWTYMCHHNVWIPVDIHIDHICRIRPCINPYHHEPTIPLENFKRGDGPKFTFKSLHAVNARHHKDLFDEVPF